MSLLAVSPGTPSFLCVRLKIARRSSVKHPAHIGLIDAHAKGTCARQHAQFSSAPFLMAFLFHIWAEACVICCAWDANLPHSGFPLFSLVSGLDIQQPFSCLGPHVPQD